MKGRHRSRSKKRRKVKTPKRTTIHYKQKQKKNSSHTCAQCGALLHGVTRSRGYSCTPSRKYGGYLCHTCVRKNLVESVRS